jgi:hypothetical protein
MRVEVLALSVIWDVLSACALIANHRGVARMHTHWWTDKADDTSHARGVLALLMLLLGAMHAAPLMDDSLLFVAVASYMWELMWVALGAAAGSMGVRSVVPSIIFCLLCLPAVVFL